MDKSEAFETLVGIVSQVNNFTIVQARVIDESIQVLAKEIKYKPIEESKQEVEELETKTKK